jgi:hypothetical protein
LEEEEDYGGKAHLGRFMLLLLGDKKEIECFDGIDCADWEFCDEYRKLPRSALAVL